MSATIIAEHWKRRRTIYVNADHLSVYHLRELIKALDKEKISDGALLSISFNQDTMRVSRISVIVDDVMKDYGPVEFNEESE